MSNKSSEGENTRPGPTALVALVTVTLPLAIYVFAREVLDVSRWAAILSMLVVLLPLGLMLRRHGRNA